MARAKYGHKVGERRLKMRTTVFLCDPMEKKTIKSRFGKKGFFIVLGDKSFSSQRISSHLVRVFENRRDLLAQYKSQENSIKFWAEWSGQNLEGANDFHYWKSIPYHRARGNEGEITTNLGSNEFPFPHSSSRVRGSKAITFIFNCSPLTCWPGRHG